MWYTGEITKWPVVNGAHVDPVSGAKIWIGDRARVGAWASVGDRASVGEGASVGDRARVGEDNPVISMHMQYVITIYCHRGVMVAQIGCKYMTIRAWLRVSKEDAIKKGLDEKYYNPLREMLKRFEK